MTLSRVVIGLVAIGALAGCGSMLDLGGEPTGAATQPPAVTDVAERDDPANGAAGAALCISSALYLTENGMMSEERALAAAEVWAGILDVIPATPEERQTAVDDAYGALEAMDDRTDQGGLRMATFNYSTEGTCADQEFQRDYLVRFGDASLMQQELDGGS